MGRSENTLTVFPSGRRSAAGGDFFLFPPFPRSRILPEKNTQYFCKNSQYFRKFYPYFRKNSQYFR